MKRSVVFLMMLLLSQQMIAQRGFLFVKKGLKKVKTYQEGDRIMLRGTDQYLYTGTITLLMNDSIYINGLPIARSAVHTVLLNRKKKTFRPDVKQLLLITGGVALVTGGLTLSKQARFPEALRAGTVIGYGPLLISFLTSKISFRKKKYRIGNKFRLQVLDFHLPLKAF